MHAVNQGKKDADTTPTGKYTYQDDVPAEKMAQVCMENYDPAFNSIARAGGMSVTVLSSALTACFQSQDSFETIYA